MPQNTSTTHKRVSFVPASDTLACASCLYSLLVRETGEQRDGDSQGNERPSGAADSPLRCCQFEASRLH